LLRDHFIALDEAVVTDGDYVSSDRFDGRLAAYDLLGLYMEPRCASLGEPWQIDTALQTSGDGVHWVDVAGSEFSVTNSALPLNGAFNAWDGMTSPLMQFVRITLHSGSGAVDGCVRVYATLRDQGGGKPNIATGGRRAP
jgi:hypothetical protein